MDNLKSDKSATAGTNFNWGRMGEAWWREAAAQVGADDRQTMFACAKHEGATATGAARLAGYGGNHNQQGYKTARTTVVQNLLALAASESKGGTDSLIDESEIRRTLTRLIRSPDPTIKLRAIESFNKIKEHALEAGRSVENDGFSDWRIARDFLRSKNGGPAYALLYCAEFELTGMPLLHDVHAAVMRDDPELWDRLRKKVNAQSGAILDWRLSDPGYQLDARKQLWKEIGLDIEESDRKRFAGVARSPEAAQQEPTHA